MFQPLYTITDQLLANIKRIDAIVNDLNNKRFPNVVLLELERTAREVSTYASTSIDGNPSPLTEVTKVLKSNQALQDLNKQIEKGKLELSINLILKIQKQVTLDLLPKFESGNFREKPVVVNDPRTGQVVYLPPDAKDVKPLIEDLVTFT